jgi:Flp pilus assembly protein TadG
MRQGFKLRLSLLKQRIKSDSSGLAAIEFALIAPLLMIMLMGVVEVSRAISMNRKFSMVTSSVADLVSRERVITAADVGTIQQIVTQILSPYSANDLSLAIIPVWANPSNATQVRVYATPTNRPTFGGADMKTQCENYEVPANMLPAGATMIVVEAFYQYTPLFIGSFMNPIEWSDKAYFNPRSGCVAFDGTNCTMPPC